MCRDFLIICTVLFSIHSGSYAIDPQQAKSRNVLVLFSLTPTTPAYRYILDGIREELEMEFGGSVSLHAEYLETEKYPKGQYPKERFDLYNKKYHDIKLDLLICVGIDIISAVKNVADSRMLNLPTISLDYDFSDYGLRNELALNDRTTIIGLKIDIDKTIAKALDLFPSTSSVYFICGSSRTDQFFTEITRMAAKKINNQIKINFITGLTMDEILRVVRALPSNSLIFVPSFYSDSNLVPYYNPEAIRLINKSANAPVFNYVDMGFGEGAFGGNIISFRKIGPLTGQIAVKILNGADPNSIKVTENDYYDCLFDWRELKKWNLTGIETENKGCTVLYREVTFLSKYWWLFTVGLLFLLIQTFLIISLIRSNRRQKKMAQQMLETDRRQMDIIREDRILRIGMMTASLSHELNQPLTAIMSTAQAGVRFIESDKADNELLKEILNNIVEDDKRAASILSSIRGMMKLERREKIRQNINMLINEVADLYKSMAIEQNCKLYLRLTEEPVFVIADSIQIQQVILNLISNASQSIEETENKVKQIIISEEAEGEYVSVSVRDFGKGIDESIKELIFEPFLTSRKEGIGVGLAISKLIIQEHQGKIAARNMPDGGAEFSFHLRIVK